MNKITDTYNIQGQDFAFPYKQYLTDLQLKGIFPQGALQIKTVLLMQAYFLCPFH